MFAFGIRLACRTRGLFADTVEPDADSAHQIRYAYLEPLLATRPYRLAAFLAAFRSTSRAHVEVPPTSSATRSRNSRSASVSRMRSSADFRFAGAFGGRPRSRLMVVSMH